MPPFRPPEGLSIMGKSQPKKLNPAQKAVLSPGQCRAARGLIDISQKDLADAAGVSLTAIKDFESGTRTPRPATLKAIQDAIEGAGVELIPVNGGGEGVRRTGEEAAVATQAKAD